MLLLPSRSRQTNQNLAQCYQLAKLIDGLILDCFSNISSYKPLFLLKSRTKDTMTGNTFIFPTFLKYWQSGTFDKMAVVSKNESCGNAYYQTIKFKQTNQIILAIQIIKYIRFTLSQPINHNTLERPYVQQNCWTKIQ